MKTATHRQPIRLTQRGKNLRDGIIVWGLTIGLGVFGGLLVAAWFRV